MEEYTCKLTEAARLTTFSLTEKREKEKEERIQEAKMVKIRLIFVNCALARICLHVAAAMFGAVP